MSKIEVNTVDVQCGSTLTLGSSGKTVALASGASQTGFGRTGTVDWQTTVKTGDFTAVSGEGYFINTTSGTITMTLPSSPSAGDIVSFSDYAKTFDTNKLTVGRGGSNIAGQAIDSTVTTEGIAATLVYADATKGWIVTESGLQSDVPGPQYISATGGTITTVCTNYKVHTFTGPGTFTVSSVGNCAGSNTVSYLVVAGGGAGGTCRAGGGGAGGFREGRTPQCTSYAVSPLNAPAGLPVSAQAYPIVVGGGGTSPQNRVHHGGCGSASSFSTITSAGGGGGASDGSPTTGNNGGSAGGGANSGNGGTGNTPPVSPPQGNPGGRSIIGNAGGGGGGATAAGGDMPSNPTAGTGGAGATTSINATPTAFAGGGGGGSSGSGAPGGTGGGGGGQGGGNPTAAGTAGTTNTGGGGGGSSEPGSGGGGAGGSGIVIIRYRFQ